MAHNGYKGMIQRDLQEFGAYLAKQVVDQMDRDGVTCLGNDIGVGTYENGTGIRQEVRLRPDEINPELITEVPKTEIRRNNWDVFLKQAIELK